MDFSVVLAISILLIVILGLTQLQLEYSWPVVRPAVEATWPMRPGMIEGFKGGPGLDLDSNSAQGINSESLKRWLPSPESVMRSNKDGSSGFGNVLDSAGPYEAGIGKPFKSYDLLPGGKPEPRVAIGPTAEGCYKTDWARNLEMSGYQQITNNYQHKYPDSCSAPNHDLILDFYKETPAFAPF
jgi:hypothetical protein